MRQKALILIALVAGLAYLPGALAGGSNEKIYLDPDTGDVLESPPAKAQNREALRYDRGAESASSEPKAWTNADGADMLTLDPDSTPGLNVVRCPDGSLHLGHAQAPHGDSSSAALCKKDTP